MGGPLTLQGAPCLFNSHPLHCCWDRAPGSGPSEPPCAGLEPPRRLGLLTSRAGSHGGWGGTSSWVSFLMRTRARGIDPPPALGRQEQIGGLEDRIDAWVWGQPGGAITGLSLLSRTVVYPAATTLWFLQHKLCAGRCCARLIVLAAPPPQPYRLGREAQRG